MVAFVENVKTGSVSSVTPISSTPTFAVDGIIDVDYSGTGGSDILAKVSSIKGKSVNSLLSSFGIYKFLIILLQPLILH